VTTVTFRAKLLAMSITIAIAASPYFGRTAATSTRGFRLRSSFRAINRLRA
jgi:hypothetical protein